jgi:2-oxoglutarate ferredoxin oxidoreductase subunit beta
MDKPRIPDCIDFDTKPSNFCPGCGYGLILKTLGQAIDEMEIGPRTVFALDIGCNLLAWDYYGLDTIQTHHGRVTPFMSGYKKAQKDAVMIGIAGDGGLYAIGLQSLLHTAHRNEPVTVIGVNNTLYAMTGGQAGPTTMKNEVTDSSPGGKFTAEKPFFGPELIKDVASENAYLARASVLDLAGMKVKFKKAIQTQLEGNFSLVEVLSFCPTNWKTNAKETVEMVETMQKVYKVGVINEK